MLGLGALLVVLGWGSTRYADTRQQAVESDDRETLTLWVGESTSAKSLVSDGSFVPGRSIYHYGVLCMAVGAVTLVMAFPRGSWQAHP